MRLTNNLPVHRAAGTTAAVTLGLLLGVSITAHAQTSDHAQSTGALQALDAQDPSAQEPTEPPQQPAEPGQPPQPGQPPPQPAAPSQPGQAEQKPPQQTFTSDTVIIFYQVLPDKTTQFEQVMKKVQDAMQQSDNAARKEQAQGMRLLKASQAAADGTIQYALVVHPVMKDTEYDPGMLVYEAFPSEANKLFTEFESFFKKDGMTGSMELNEVLSFGSGAPGGGN